MTSDELDDGAMFDLLQAQREFKQAKAEADETVRLAREQRENTVRAALAGGISLRTAAAATGLSHMRIAQIRDGE